MPSNTLTHLSDAVLLRDLAALVAQDRLTTAVLLAHIAEVDARRLFVPAGYPSMHAYCVDELHQSEDAAYRRITAARAGLEFPALFAALAEGRLHLAAVSLLAPHLTHENVNELIEVATHRRKSEIEELLARRFTLQAVPASPRCVPAMTYEPLQLVPGRVGTEAAAVDTFDESAPGLLDTSLGMPPPLSPERFLVQLTIPKSTREKLRHAQALLSHAVPTGDVAQVFDRALDALIHQLEKRKLGAITPRSRLRRSTAGPGPESGAGMLRALRSRYVPAPVRRAVWERDEGQCTFVSAKGTRCKARRFLEFDHVDPVARGGQATVDKMRLRCRAHNQYEAERAFGAGFMSRKRHEARLAAAKSRARTDAEERAAAKEQAAREQIRDVVAGLLNLGCRANEARRAAELSGTLQDATLEERMRAALKFLSRGSIQVSGSAGVSCAL
jgi:hypothetical protein